MSQKLRDLENNLYKLISDEIDRFSTLEMSGTLPQVFPNLVVMYEFYRLIRGEAFFDDPEFIHSRTPEEQKELYKREAELKQKISDLRSRLNPNDERTQNYIKEMQKWFEVSPISNSLE